MADLEGLEGAVRPRHILDSHPKTPILRTMRTRPDGHYYLEEIFRHEGETRIRITPIRDGQDTIKPK